MARLEWNWIFFILLLLLIITKKLVLSGKCDCKNSLGGLEETKHALEKIKQSEDTAVKNIQSALEAIKLCDEGFAEFGQECDCKNSTGFLHDVKDFLGKSGKSREWTINRIDTAFELIKKASSQKRKDKWKEFYDLLDEIRRKINSNKKGEQMIKTKMNSALKIVRHCGKAFEKFGYDCECTNPYNLLEKAKELIEGITPAAKLAKKIELTVEAVEHCLEGVKSCPDGFIKLDTYDSIVDYDVCIKCLPEIDDWDAAKRRCGQMGAFIARPKSRSDIAPITTKCGSVTTIVSKHKIFWFGFRRPQYVQNIYDGSNFKDYETHRTINPDGWYAHKPANPKGDCVANLYGYQFTDVACSGPHLGIVCEKAVGSYCQSA